MAFISIAQNKTWTHGSRQYAAGTHKVTDAVAARAHTLKMRYGWAWLTVPDERPVLEAVDPNARAGKLTLADVKLGSEAAAIAVNKELADKTAAAQVTPMVPDVDATPQPFKCEECDESFPSKASRTRHVNVNHKAPKAAEKE